MQEICSKYGVVAYTDIGEGTSEVCICACIHYWFACSCVCFCMLQLIVNFHWCSMRVYVYMYVQGYIRYSTSGCVENLVNAETMCGVKFTAVSGMLMYLVLHVQVYTWMYIHVHANGNTFCSCVHVFSIHLEQMRTRGPIT